MKNEILICDCSSMEHQIVISYDDEDKLAYCHIYLHKRGFFTRIKIALKYIFGYKCKYGHWDEFIFCKDDADKIKELSKLLKTK